MPCLCLFLCPFLQTDYTRILSLHPMGTAGGHSARKAECLSLRMTKEGGAHPREARLTNWGPTIWINEIREGIDCHLKSLRETILGPTKENSLIALWGSSGSKEIQTVTWPTDSQCIPREEWETTVASEASAKRGSLSVWCHLYVESKIWHKWTYLQNRNRLIDIENRLVVAKGQGEGWIGSLGLADANCYI